MYIYTYVDIMYRWLHVESWPDPAKYVHTQTNIRTYMNIHEYIYMHIFTHTYIHLQATYILTNKHTHSLTRTHAHTFSLSLSPSSAHPTHISSRALNLQVPHLERKSMFVLEILIEKDWFLFRMWTCTKFHIHKRHQWGFGHKFTDNSRQHSGSNFGGNDKKTWHN